MGWFKNLFVAKPEDHTLDWKMQPFSEEDFLVDALENYTDPHLNMILGFVREIVPKKLRDRVYVGGGFACHLAGVTRSHDDIDIFCTQKTFVLVKNFIVDNRIAFRVLDSDKDTIFKFEYEGFEFDLVDSSAILIESVQKLIELFDFNWSMVAIDLECEVIVCHKDALSTIPQVNSARIDDRIEDTIQRLEKYKDRLTKEPNMTAYNCLMQGLDMRQKAMPLDTDMPGSGYLGY